MALAFKLWWCPWGIRLGQRLPFGISYALMMVLLINSTELTALLWPSFHRLRCSFGNDCDKCDSPYRGRCWLKDCMRWLSFGTIGTRWSGGNPPLQGHNLGALLLDYFDLLASLALTVICQSFYNARFCWLPALVGLLAGFIIFWFAEPGQIKFCAAFPHWPFGWNFCCFCMIAILWRRLCFLAAGGGEELLFRVVVERVLMMLWLYVVVVFAASSSLASTHHSHLFLDTSCTDDGFYSRNRSATVLLKYWNHTL